MNPPWIRETKSGALLLDLLAKPRAKASKLAGIHDGRIRVDIASPPVDGEANDEVVRFFSKLLKIPQNEIQITSGVTSKRKTLLFPPEAKKMLLNQLSLVSES